MADELFCNLFRVNLEDLPPFIRDASEINADTRAKAERLLDECSSVLDRLTLLACSRQGVIPVELLVSTQQQTNSSSSVPRGRSTGGGGDGSNECGRSLSAGNNSGGGFSVKDAVAVAREDNNNGQRLALIAIVGKERRAVCRALFSGYAARLDREARFKDQLRVPRRRRQIVPSVLLNHEENKLHTELVAMETSEESLSRNRRLRTLQEQVESDTIPSSNGDGDGGSANHNNTSAAATAFEPMLGMRNRKEFDAVRSLLDVQSSTEAAERKFEEDMAQIAIKGEKRIAKIRQKQISDIIRESEATHAREQMLKHLQEREDAWRQSKEEKKQALHLKIVEMDELREQKVAKHEEEAIQRIQAKKMRLVSKITRHNAKIATIQEQREKERVEKAAKLERQMEEGRARAEAKKEEAREAAELLGTEVAMRQELHGSRKRNIDTRRHLIKASTEKVHGQRLQRSLLLKDMQDNDPYYDELDQESQRRTNAAAKRKVELNSQRAAKFRASVEEHSKRRGQGAEKQMSIESERIDWCSALDHNWEVRKAHVEDLKKSQRDAAELLAEANRIRMETHAANLERIRRAEAYTQRVRKAVVEAQDEHIELRKHADEDQRTVLKRSRVLIGKQQETMMLSLEQIRARGDAIPDDPDELRKVVEAQEAIQKGAIMSNVSDVMPTSLAEISRASVDKRRRKSSTFKSSRGGDGGGGGIVSSSSPPPRGGASTPGLYAGGNNSSTDGASPKGGPTTTSTPIPSMESLITKRIRRPASTMF